MCLWCSEKSKMYKKVEDVQKHMVDSGHTKMKHEGETLLGMYSTIFIPFAKRWYLVWKKKYLKVGKNMRKIFFSLKKYFINNGMLVVSSSWVSKLFFNHYLYSTEGVILCIIFGCLTKSHYHATSLIG